MIEIESKKTHEPRPKWGRFYNYTKRPVPFKFCHVPWCSCGWCRFESGARCFPIQNFLPPVHFLNNKSGLRSKIKTADFDVLLDGCWRQLCKGCGRWGEQLPPPLSWNEVHDRSWHHPPTHRRPSHDSCLQPCNTLAPLALCCAKTNIICCKTPNLNTYGVYQRPPSTCHFFRTKICWRFLSVTLVLIWWGEREDGQKSFC